VSILFFWKILLLPLYHLSFTFPSPCICLERAATAKDRLSTLPLNQWFLFNGIAVSLSSEDDARDFERTFKEPSLFFFQAVEEGAIDFPLFESHESSSLGMKSSESITNELFLNGPSVGELLKSRPRTCLIRSKF
jgi:hypothetical protein